MTVAPVTSPLQTEEPMEIARRMLADQFVTESGKNGLLYWRGAFWQWYGRKWVRRDEEWMMFSVLLGLENSMVRDGNSINRYGVTPPKARDVVACLKSLVVLAAVDTPCWLEGRENRPDPKKCVAFEDVVVDVGGTAAAAVDGRVEEWKTVERDENWFDVTVVPCEWDPQAECPRWVRCHEEWFQGDEESKRLSQRVMGCALMATREWGRAPLLIGKIRGGKGVWVKTLARMAGPAFCGTSMNDLVGNHGLDGVQWGRVVSVGEVSELDNASGERFVATWKNIVGQDPVAVNPKNIRQTMSLVIGAMIVMTSNEIPNLPNKGRGMSGKLLILPFDHSFLGREQLDLEEVIAGEMKGVARWAVEGALGLVMGRTDLERWPVSERAEEVLRLYQLQNNPYDPFLEARFVVNPQGFVVSRVVQHQWNEWVASTGVRLHVPSNQLLLRLEQETTWGVRRYREQDGGARGLKGLSLRREHEDEI